MLTIDNYIGEFIGANMYVLDNGHSSIIIDPCVSYKFIEKRLNHPLSLVLITHAHVDHIFHLKDYIGLNVPIGAHKYAFGYMTDPKQNLSAEFGQSLCINISESHRLIIHDGEKLTWDDGIITVLGTPGHTDDSLTFKIDNNLFTGDCLFQGSVGRTDFWNSNASDMLKSLQKIMSLKGDYNIYPGHDGATTLLYECDNNPFLA